MANEFVLISPPKVDKVCRKGKRVFSVLLNTKQTLPRLFSSRAFVFAVHLAASAKFAMVSSVLFQLSLQSLQGLYRRRGLSNRIVPGWGKKVWTSRSLTFRPVLGVVQKPMASAVQTARRSGPDFFLAWAGALGRSAKLDSSGLGSGARPTERTRSSLL